MRVGHVLYIFIQLKKVKERLLVAPRVKRVVYLY